MHNSIFCKNALVQSLVPSSVKTPKTHRFRCFSLLATRPLQTLKIINFGVMQWSLENLSERNDMNCTVCGRNLQKDSRYCDLCGTKLPEEMRVHQPQEQNFQLGGFDFGVLAKWIVISLGITFLLGFFLRFLGLPILFGALFLPFVFRKKFN